MPTSSSRSESERLAALHHLRILDTPPEEGFERVTRLATRWLDLPIALVTLVDEDRQWFKSCAGISLQETDRSVSFCAHNLEGDSIMVVENATEDPRFADNPLVTGPPGIRFYAGAPLVTPGGHVLGSLCVIDTVPRSADTVDLDTLRSLAAMVVTELELRAVNDTLQRRNREVHILTQQLKDAAEVNRSRLSHLLQEDLKQVLQASRMNLENVTAAETIPDEAVRRLRRASAYLDDALDIVSTLSTRFAPPVENQSLRDTLDWLAETMREHHGLSVTILGGEPAFGADEALNTLLFGFVRELLFEAARRTDSVSVRLIGTASHLRLTMDDLELGAAFIARLLHGEGKLAHTRAQVESLGGRVQVESTSASGSSITIEVPMPTGRPSPFVPLL